MSVDFFLRFLISYINKKFKLIQKVSCIYNMLQKPKDSSNGEYCLNIQKLVHTCGKCDKLDSN